MYLENIISPSDVKKLVPEQMTARERTLLNTYHQRVYETISPYLEADEREWLKTATREI